MYIPMMIKLWALKDCGRYKAFVNKISDLKDSIIFD